MTVDGVQDLCLPSVWLSRALDLLISESTDILINYMNSYSLYQRGSNEKHAMA